MKHRSHRRPPQAVRDHIDRHRRWRYRLWCAQHGRCYWCHRPIPWNSSANHGDSVTLDHLIPLSAGGPDEFTNVVVACWQCNQARADHRPPSES